MQLLTGDVFGTEDSSDWPGVAEVSGKILGVINFSEGNN